jgi:biotin transport system substrate-specific component
MVKVETLKQKNIIEEKAKVKEIILILALTMAMCVSSHIKIPAFPVPFTMQVLIAALCGFMLNGKKTIIPLITYLIYGMAGAFVFANGGGIGYLLSPTFGYVLGFIAMAYLIGTLMERQEEITFKKLFGIGMIGVFAMYIIGASYLYIMLGNTISVMQAIIQGIIIFIPYDILKLLVAVSITKKVIKKRNEV